MKIGIITQPLRTNYGGILQNYALQTILKRRGHTVVTLGRESLIRVKYPRYILTLTKRFFLKCFGKYSGSLFREKKYNQDYPIFTQHTLRFVKERIHHTEIHDFSKELSHKDYDAYIVGSDQVWRPSYNKIENTFLDFTSGWNVKRVAYAASFGTDDWEFSKEQTETCQNLIKKFDAVSVRENSGVKLCKDYLHADAIHVLDPTMLLQKTDYQELISDIYTKPINGQIFVHILDKTHDKQSLIDKIEYKMTWKSFTVNQEIDEHCVDSPIELRIQPPIEQWLNAFQQAQIIITDSFHATVFSILFNKPFIVYANEQRGSARFKSLLSMFNLDSRIIASSDQFKEEMLEPIDFTETNLKLDMLRKHSIDFLFQYI